MNTKTVLACSAAVIAFALIVAPLAISQDALAVKNKANKPLSNQTISINKAYQLAAAVISYLVTT